MATIRCAVQRAKAMALELAKDDSTPTAGISFGEIRRAYLFHKGPDLSAKRLRFVKLTLDLFFAELLEPKGRPFRMDDFGQNQVETYLAARRSGRIRANDRRAADTPRDGTLRNEILCLSTVCNWAVDEKRNGRRLLERNPVRGLRLPKEKNVRRPVASPDRFGKLLEVSGKVDPRSQFRALLVLAWHTGRRINAICHLRAADILLGEDRVRAALAELGKNESWASQWPNAIRWSAEYDKVGLEDVTPISATVVRELESYPRCNPRVGDAWLFTMDTDPERPQTNAGAAHYLGPC